MAGGVFVRLLARARARGEPQGLRKSAEAAWHRRFVALLPVATQRAFGESLCERLPGQGVEGETPSTQSVLEEARYGW